MKRNVTLIVVLMMVFTLGLVAGTCDVKKEKVKPADIDKGLKKYTNTKWNVLKKHSVTYAVSGNEKVDDFSRQSAVVYASFLQAEHTSDLTSKDMQKLKKDKDTKAKNEAQDNLKIAQDVLLKASNAAPDLIKSGNELAANYKDLIKDFSKAPAIAEAMKNSISNLTQVVTESPDLVKKLGKQVTALAD